MYQIFAVVIPLFLVIATGALLRAIKVADEKWIEVFNKFELYVGFPALILNSLLNIDQAHVIGLDVIAYNVLLLIGVVVFTYLVGAIFKMEKDLRNSYVICVFFGNVAYLGIPFITALYKGSSASVAIHVALYLLVLFTIGIAILEASSKEKKGTVTIVRNIFKNPLIISVLVGLLLFGIQVKPPDVVNKALQMLANSASPVALLALGMFIYRKVEFKKEFVYAVVLAVFKLIALPALFYLFAAILGLGSQFNISIIEAGMPIAVTTFALSQIYPLNKNVIALSILISTLLSVVTLPLLAGFIH